MVGWRGAADLLVRWGWVAFPAALLSVLFGHDEYAQYVAGFVIIYGLSALGLDWLMGRAGVVSLGNGAMMAFGGLGAGYLAQHSWASFPLTLLLVTLAGAVLGWLLSLPATRLQGVYFALVTLALQVVVVFAGHRYQRTTTDFLGGIPLPAPAVGSYEIELGRPWLAMLAGFLGVAVLLLWNMYRGQPGRAWLAVRENELAARTIGVRARPAKTAAFVGSTALISLSGGLLAYYTGRVSPDTFTLTFAISFVVMVIVGGVRSISGVLLGTSIVTILPLALGQYVASLPALAGGLTGWFKDNVFFINSGLFGVLVLVVLLYMPRGIVPTLSTGLRGLGSRLDRSRRPATAASAAAGAPGAVVTDTRTALRAVNDPVADDRPPLLRLQDLRLTYRNGAQALAGADLAVQPGELVAVVGRNGVGKTSLLRAITGFYRADGVRVSGRITFDGRELAGASVGLAARLGIALVPEREKVFAGLTVGEQLRHVGDVAAAEAAMPREWPMLTRRWDTRAGLLSGGERQLLALALAASLRPRLLLIDELSLGLSPVAIDRVAAAILELREHAGTTILLVEQNVDVARRLSDRVLLMEAGKLLASWTGDSTDQPPDQAPTTPAPAPSAPAGSAAQLGRPAVPRGRNA